MSKIEDKHIATDCHDLVTRTVQNHMKPFILVTMQEHEQTRKEFNEVKRLIKDINRINVHDIVQYGLILMLGLGMIFLLTGFYM